MSLRSGYVTVSIAAFAAVIGLARADPQHSPFLPANAPSDASTQDPNAIELHGIMPTDNGIKYNIYDPAKKMGVWVGVNEAGEGFLIKSADPKNNTVTVATNGEMRVLALAKGRVLSQSAPGLPAGPAVLHPTPADEQARLQAVADEVRRRRLLREQAAQAQANGEPPPVDPNAAQNMQPRRVRRGGQ